VTTDICLSPQYDWYIVLSKISKSGFQPLPIPKNIPMGQEVQRKRKEPTLRRTVYGSLLLLPKTDTGELSVTPGSAKTETK